MAAPMNSSATTFSKQTISLITLGNQLDLHCVTTTLASPSVDLFSALGSTPRKPFSSFPKSGGAWSTTARLPAPKYPPEQSCREPSQHRSVPSQSSTLSPSFVSGQPPRKSPTSIPRRPPTSRTFTRSCPRLDPMAPSVSPHETCSTFGRKL